MAVKLYRDIAIVLRTQKLGEADRIATVFLKRHGIKRVVARGVRKTTSKFGATLEPFMLIDLQNYTGRTLDTVTQAEMIQPYGEEIIANYDVFLDANIIVETAERLNDGASADNQFDLLAGALRTLAAKKIPSGIVRDAYLSRAIGLSGWAPELDVCVVCQRLGPHSHVSNELGGAVCVEHQHPGSFKVQAETIALLNAYFQGDWGKSLSSSSASYSQAAGFLASYLQWHLEKSLKSISIAQRTIAAR